MKFLSCLPTMKRRMMQLSQLNQIPLREIRKLFSSLQIPEVQSIAGKYRGAFVGPAWVRTSVKPALWITGLGGWWGKELYENGTGINILFRDGKFTTRFRMKFLQARSAVDSRDGLAMHYLQDNLLLWFFIVDEIRHLDESMLLGMTRPRIPRLRWFALPFVLQKQDSRSGSFRK